MSGPVQQSLHVCNQTVAIQHSIGTRTVLTFVHFSILLQRIHLSHKLVWEIK